MKNTPTQISPPILKEGLVTAIQAQKHTHNRVNIFIDDQFAFAIFRELLADYAIYKGKRLSIEAQQTILDADALMRAKKLVLDTLSRQTRTTQQIRQKLKEKGFQESIITQVIQRFEELHYLDDQQYARSFIEHRLNNKGYGPRRIREELRRKGIQGPWVQQLLDEFQDSDAPLQAALTQAQKKWRQLQRETDQRKRLKKLNDFLLRRGFDFETVRSVLRKIQEDFEE